MTVRAYVRVSTAEQNCELQVRELREYAERQGWRIAEVYQDVSSGARASRIALNQLMLHIRARKLDCLLVWKLDRFGRSLPESEQFLAKRRYRKVRRGNDHQSSVSEWVRGW